MVISLKQTNLYQYLSERIQTTRLISEPTNTNQPTNLKKNDLSYGERFK